MEGYGMYPMDQKLRKHHMVKQMQPNIVILCQRMIWMRHRCRGIMAMPMIFLKYRERKQAHLKRLRMRSL